MNEVKRYDLTESCDTGEIDITPVPSHLEGRFVTYEDYAALKAERDALAAQPVRRLTLPAGYTMSCEPTRYIAVNDVARLLQGLGFAIDVEEADE